MSPASYLTAPPRVAVAEYSTGASILPIALFWFSLTFALVAGVAAAVFLVVRAVQFWRMTRVFMFNAAGAAEVLSASAEALSARAPADTLPLQRSAERLQGSSAQLRILLDEVNRVAGVWRRARKTYLTK
jgi:hypothetical protein